MDIVFSINQLAMEGLGPTLSSLIRHCSDLNKIRLWFFCTNLECQDKKNIETLLNSENYRGKVDFIDFDAVRLFGHFKSLHGDWTTYGRLLINEYIQSDKALYLDSDIIVAVDVIQLDEYDFDGNVLAAVYGSPVNWAQEGTFFISELNWLPDTAYFNAGVILFNLKTWRERNMEQQWRDFAEKHPDDLISVDQTILNAVCMGKFKQLPSHYNLPWYAWEKCPAAAENAILHFVGSPKPWDIMGALLHKGYKTWHSYNTRLWVKKYGGLTRQKIIRTWRIRKSIIKSFLHTVR